MTTGNPNEGIRITIEDLAGVEVPPASAGPILAPAPGCPSYGTISEASGIEMPVAEKGSILLRGWFYLGLAGLVGGLLGWGVCEPWFVDGGGLHLANIVLIPVVVALVTVGCGIAESVVERSAIKALLRTAMALPLSLVLGFLFNVGADIVFGFGLLLCRRLGVTHHSNPIFWMARSLAWAAFGVVGGLVYGIVGQSFKKGKYGVLGGVLGAAAGGMLFDPISLLFGGHSGVASRAVGFAMFGMATGVMMGVVESALKDRWLYVTSGPLAGKQFILYKPQTVIGSNQQSDIYLFKDPAIQPAHAILASNGSRISLRAQGVVYVSGSPVSNRVLNDGDMIQIGRYSFRYKERSRP